MSRDGDAVSETAAGQPSIEQVVLGLIPGLPRVHLLNEVLAYETGDEHVEDFRRAARGEQSTCSHRSESSAGRASEYTSAFPPCGTKGGWESSVAVPCGHSR